MKNLIRLLMALLARALFGPEESAKIRLTFHLSGTDADGRPLPSSSVPGPVIDNPLRHRPRLRVVDALMLLVAVLGMALTSIDPVVWCAAPFCRVTTAGLNALLSSTLANSVTSTTWFVGLMKYVAADGVTNGTTTFTSASGTFSAGTDVGRAILLRGAGPSGGDLATTIAAVGSSTSITLGTAASNSATGVQYAMDCRIADTMASHTSFVESTTYSNVTRPAWTPGAVSAGSVSNTASQAAFNINGTDYIFGALLTSNSTVGGNTGTLYGAGVNSGNVALAVTSGATVNVTITATATST